MSNSVASVWEIFLGVNFAFPVVFFTFFLLLTTVYWCIAMFGLVDIDVLDVDANSDIDLELDANPDIGSVSGLLMRLGLNGVPLTIIITLIAFFGWLICLLTVYYVMPLVPTTLLKMAFGVALLLFAFYLATLLTAWAIKPIRPIFLAANQQKQVMTIGRTAIVRTGKVDHTFGEANLEDGGAGLIIKVRAYEGNEFKKGDRVVLLEHDKVQNTYKVISEKEYQN